jgi:PPOX class probable F420-dependent enzyme
VVWVTREGDEVLISVLARRRKARNVARDPRVSVTVYDLANPYESVEIRGSAELVDDPERSLAVALARKYLGVDPEPEPPEDPRLIVRVVPERVVNFRA